MTFNERALSLTRQFLLPKVMYNVFGSNVAAARLIGNGNRGKGSAIEKAIKYTNSNNAISFSGMDTFQAQQLSTKIRLRLDMRGARQGFGISGLDLVANQDSEVRMTDLLKENLDEVQDELFDQVGTYSYGDGSGNFGKDPVGLGGIIDDGTNAAIFENQSRSTYPVLRSTVTDLTSVAGQISLPRLATLYSNVSSGTGSTVPSLIISGENERDLYEQLLTPTVREQYSSMGYYSVTKDSRGTVRQGSNQGLAGMQGFVALSYKGIPWVGDEKSDSNDPNAIKMLNENFLDWWGWQNNQLGYEPITFSHTQVETSYAESPMSDFTGFSYKPMISAQNQFAGIGDMLIIGNMGSWRPNRLGKLTNATSV